MVKSLLGKSRSIAAVVSSAVVWSASAGVGQASAAVDTERQQGKRSQPSVRDGQSSLVRLNAEIAPKLSADKTAGTWIDSTAGKLIVNVVAGVKVPATVTNHPRVRVHRVKRSGKQLQAIRNRVEVAQRKHHPRNVAWSVDMPENVVTVRVGHSGLRVGRLDPGTTAFVAAVRKLSPEVKVVPFSGELTPTADVWGGDETTNIAFTCSAGFNATNSEGKNFVLTAGHCVKKGGLWYHHGLAIGGIGSFSYGPHDWGVIHYISISAAKPTNNVNTYGGEELKITGHAAPEVGGKVCKSGTRTGYTCGTISKVNEDLVLTDGTLLKGMAIATGMCNLPGDSGGSVVMPNDDGTTATAAGILSGSANEFAQEGKCPHDHGKSDEDVVLVFEPIERALSESNLSLRTG